MARKSKTPDPTPDPEPASSGSDSEEYDSEAENSQEEHTDDSNSENGDDSFDGSSAGFESQGSSDDDDDRLKRQGEESDDDSFDGEEGGVQILDTEILDAPRQWKRDVMGAKKSDGEEEMDPEKAKEVAAYMHTDDLSSDDEDPEGTNNRIGRIPLHWYDDYDHIGYDAHGSKVIKSSEGNLLDQVLQNEDDVDGKKYTVYDALNAKNVELTERQITLIRRLQSGAFAHPEHDANPDYVDYYSGIPEISGINSNRYEKKSRFQPSAYEKLQVRRLLHRLKCGSINMDFLEGKVRDMNDYKKKQEDSDKPFLLWKGDEEDELALRKGPQHIAPPKQPPPGHALSYRPPEEYLPSQEELEEWEKLDPEDRPHGNFIPKQFDNLRSVGAYEHAVKERFERCLDLYLCPRVMKRRLNIDPESLVPRLPRASDLRPFPTTKCIEYNDGEVGAVRCLSVSPDGQFMVSGGEDGVVRLWEVQTGRLVRKWDLGDVIAKVVEKEEEVSLCCRTAAAFTLRVLT